jgi:tripartite-type tricarboxylate transporter receptor subunit TctC
MKLPRRQFLHLAAGAASLPAVSRIAMAQSYPSQLVRIIAGFPAGSTTDIVARLIGQWLEGRLGRPFIVENRAGAGGTIGTEAAVRASPDGYTLLVVSSAHAINATLYNNLKFNIVRDIAPIAAVVSLPNVMVVNPSVSARTVSEFVAYAKANPGKLNMASGGNGSSSHLAGELFKMMAGVNLVHVPYRGQPAALTDLLGGQVHVSFAPMPPSIEHIRAGKLRALAVTTPTRWDLLPDVPTVSEFLPGYEASTWDGLGAPRNTPVEIIEKLNREVNAGLADAKFGASLADIGGIALGGSPTDFGKLVADETEKWGKVVKLAGIKPQ